MGAQFPLASTQNAAIGQFGDARLTQNRTGSLKYRVATPCKTEGLPVLELDCVSPEMAKL